MRGWGCIMHRGWGVWEWLAVEKIITKSVKFLHFQFHRFLKYFFTHLLFQIRDADINQAKALFCEKNVVELEASLVGGPADVPVNKTGLV